MAALPEEAFNPLIPLKPDDAKRLARHIAEHGFVSFSPHASEEMAKDDLQTADCLNLLRAGVFEAPELINDELRYKVRTKRMVFVVVFRSNERLRVVTAWRNR
jgi:hypothetical protein